MTPAETIAKLEAWTENKVVAPPTIIRAFCKEMRDKQYGEEETAQAFYFFLCGWNACDHYRSVRHPRRIKP